MPKPMERFLHTYEINAIKNINKAGVWVTGGSATALLTAFASGATTEAAVVAAGLATIGVFGGVAILAIPVGIGIARATFWKKNRKGMANNKKGGVLTLDEYQNHMDWDCYWTTIAVIGYERTGKTLMKERIRGIESQLGQKSDSTKDLEIHITILDPDRKIFAVLLDDKGAIDKASANQVDLVIEVIKRARIIILVLDHADTDKHGNSTLLDENRLKCQEKFIKQTLIQHIKQEKEDVGANKLPLRSVMVVMNKADSWESTKHANRIREWTEEQARRINEELSCDTPTYYLSVQDLKHAGYSSFFSNLLYNVEEK